MVDFACKNINLEELIKCSFQINRSEYKVLKHLLESDEEDVKTIAESLNFDRSTVQKALQKLVEKDLVIKRQRNLENGGYLYIYRSRNREEIKEEIIDLMENWCKKAKSAVEDI